MAIQLRDYQKNSLVEIKKSWMGGKRAPLLVLPTGAGKTYTFSYIVKNLEKAGRTVWIVVHRDNLVQQTSKSFNNLGIKHGIIGAGYSESLFNNVQIVKVGSIAPKINDKLKGKTNKIGQFDIDRFPLPEFIIIDEAHHTTAGGWETLTSYYNNAKYLGVTATPERLDGKMLGNHSGGFFDDLIIGPSMKELVIRGHLANSKYFNFANYSNESKTRTNGDFDPETAGKMMSKPFILNNVVQKYKSICDGASAIVFCCNVEHAENVAEEFTANGYKAIALVGNVKFNQQQRILDDLGNDKIQIVTACEIISEGTDVPNVTATILCRPTWSLALYLQQYGRGIRVAPDGRQKYTLDMVGNFNRHGHPLMDRDWQIEGQRKTKKTREAEIDSFKIKNCPHCFGSFEASEVKDNICPNCGQIIGSKQRQINIVDGELEEVIWDEIEIEKQRWHEEQDKLRIQQEKKDEKRNFWRSIYACETKEEMRKIIEAKGYKAGFLHVTWERIQKKRNKQSV